MSRHTLLTRGMTFEWDDNDPRPWSDERQLLYIYDEIGKLHNLTTYIGTDPYESWNTKVRNLQGSVIDWILELKATKPEEN